MNEPLSSLNVTAKVELEKVGVPVTLDPRGLFLCVPCCSPAAGSHSPAFVTGLIPPGNLGDPSVSSYSVRFLLEAQQLICQLQVLGCDVFGAHILPLGPQDTLQPPGPPLPASASSTRQPKPSLHNVHAVSSLCSRSLLWSSIPLPGGLGGQQPPARPVTCPPLKPPLQLDSAPQAIPRTPDAPTWVTGLPSLGQNFPPRDPEPATSSPGVPALRPGLPTAPRPPVAPVLSPILHGPHV